MEKAVFISNIVLIIIYVISLAVVCLVSYVNEGKNDETILKENFQKEMKKVNEDRYKTYCELLSKINGLEIKMNQILCNVGDDLFIVVDFNGQGKLRGVYDELELALQARDMIYDEEHEGCSIYTVTLNEDIQPGQLDVDHIVE